MPRKCFSFKINDLIKKNLKPENLFCVAVKQAKRLTKRLNKNKKSTEDSDSDGDDLVRIFD